MASRKLSQYGDDVLRTRASPVTGFGTDELRELERDMFDTCAEAEGAGLAAPQIGISLRAFVVDCPEFPEEPDDPRRQFAIFNPELTRSEGTVDSDEGCLSLPGIRVVVKRARRVVIRGCDVEGREMEIEADGLVSRCIQHEIDHLEGVLLIDRASSLKRQLLKRQLEEIASD